LPEGVILSRKPRKAVQVFPEALFGPEPSSEVVIWILPGWRIDADWGSMRKALQARTSACAIVGLV